MTQTLFPDPADIGPRLKQAREFLNLKQKEFAALIKVPQPNLSDYENNKVVPEQRTIEDIVRRAGINEAWFATGQGPILKPIEKEGENVIRGNARPLGLDIPEGYVEIPFVSYKVWATFTDNFSDFDFKDVQETYPVWSARLPKGQPENRMVFEILGDSMEERLYERDVILTHLVDEGDFEYLNSGIYVVAYHNQLVIKRVIDNDLQTNGTLTLHSDNAKRGKVIVRRSDLRQIWKFVAVIYSTHQ